MEFGCPMLCTENSIKIKRNMQRKQSEQFAFPCDKKCSCQDVCALQYMASKCFQHMCSMVGRVVIIMQMCLTFTLVEVNLSYYVATTDMCGFIDCTSNVNNKRSNYLLKLQ